MTKLETSSPTVSLEAMLFSCTIDAKEGRQVTVTDTPGAFLHADMKQNAHMLLEGTIPKIIVKLKPRLYRNTHKKQTRQTPVVCKTQEGLIWATASHTNFI